MEVLLFISVVVVLLCSMKVLGRVLDDASMEDDMGVALDGTILGSILCVISWVAGYFVLSRTITWAVVMLASMPQLFIPIFMVALLIGGATTGKKSSQ